MTYRMKTRTRLVKRKQADILSFEKRMRVLEDTIGEVSGTRAGA